MDSAVVRLISLVQNRPELYRFKSEKDKNKDVMDRLWKEVASEMNCPEADCRQKWVTLRNCYARTLREERNHIAAKPWYLKDSMSFLKDYMRLNRKRDTKKSHLKSNLNAFNTMQHGCSIDIESSCSLPSPPNENSNYSATSLRSHSMTFPRTFDEPPMIMFPLENQMIDEPEVNENYLQKFPADEVSNGSTISIKSSPTPPSERVEELKENFSQTQNMEGSSSNSNCLFLTSLLPDLNKLSEKKQRIFKRKTIELLEVLFDEDENDSSIRCHCYQSRRTSNLDEGATWPSIQLVPHQTAKFN